MTVIAAKVDSGVITMAADTTSMTNTGTVIYGCEKIVRHTIGNRHQMLLAFAGNAALKTAVRRHLKVDDAPDPQAGHDKVTRWVEALAEAIAEVAVEARPALTDENGLLDSGGMLNQQAVTPIDGDFWAIGSGSDLALGYLTATEDVGVEAVTGAVEVAVRFDNGCRLTPGKGPQIEVLDA